MLLLLLEFNFLFYINNARLDRYSREFSEENKFELLRSLENCGWPIKEQDINAVEKEIELAHKYIQQSRDIRDLIVRKEDIIEKETIITSENVIKKKFLCLL